MGSNRDDKFILKKYLLTENSKVSLTDITGHNDPWPVEWDRMFIDGIEVKYTYMRITPPGQEHVDILCPANAIKEYQNVKDAFFDFEDIGYWFNPIQNGGLKALVDSFNDGSYFKDAIQPWATSFERLVEDGHFKLINKEDAELLGFKLTMKEALIIKQKQVKDAIKKANQSGWDL